MGNHRRRLPADTDLVEYLLSLTPERRAEAIDQLGPEQRDSLDRDWPSWAHDGQQPPTACPDGSVWRTWVIMAGRGFGKTLAGAKWITARIATEEQLHIALVGATLDEARRVMVEGRSGLLNVADAWVKDWNPTLRRLRFRTGAEAILFSGASPEQLRGPEHHLAWCDELAKWEKAQETWDMLQFGLRLGDWPRALITTTPRPGPVLTGILAEPDTVKTGGPTSANPHTAEAWRESTRRLYAGTRLGEQELEGKLLPDVPGALWTVELLARCRANSPSPSGSKPPLGSSGGRTCGFDGLGVGPASEMFARNDPVRTAPGSPQPCRGHGGRVIRDAESQNPSPREAEESQMPQADGASPGNGEGKDLSAPPRLRANPNFLRIVIAVDPPTGDGTCGIIACAKDATGQAHILADHSVTAVSPEAWARAVANAVRIWTIKSSPGFPGEGDHAKHGGGAPPPSSGRSPSPRNRGVDQRELTPLVVAEKNQGGKMVKAVLHTADPKLRVKLVTATVGKAERAAPVAMLFEAGRVVLHGRSPELEAEMLGMIAGGDYQGPGHSPDRADAMVWALTELMLGPEPAPPRVRGF